jgi:hypothetical protein
VQQAVNDAFDLVGDDAPGRVIHELDIREHFVTRGKVAIFEAF